MRSYVNPFKSRTSEQVLHQGLERYLKTFGVDALDLLPDELWVRPLVIRSAPGAGKTSLLRAVDAETLSGISRRRSAYEELTSRLQEMGVLDQDAEPLVLGFRVPLMRDFRSIIDLEPERAVAQRMFLRLLDARIVAAFCESLEHLFPSVDSAHNSQVELVPDPSSRHALERIGGPTPAGLKHWASNTEIEILDRLDAVLPRDTFGDGHAVAYSLRALSGIQIHRAGSPTHLRPLLLLDDGQELDRGQRKLLLDALHDRELRLARWYTERYSAMEADELVGDGEPRRTSEPVLLEHEAARMGTGTRRGAKTRRYERLLADIASRRAMASLREYDDEDRDFVELLDADGGAGLEARAEYAGSVIRDRLMKQTDGNVRFLTWFADADSLAPLERARRWREIEILVARDLSRADVPMFEVELADAERKLRSDSAIREAAELWLRREFGLPFYFGSDRVAKLATENIEQYLNIAADLFDEMLTGITLRRGAVVERVRQDAAITYASEQFWKTIPDRRTGGRTIQQLLRHIAKLCRAETYRPKAPYAPGVTGTALSMRDRDRLLNPETRAKIPGADALYTALHGAIGHNLLRAHTDRSVKNGRWMVLYLNRLTCVRYGLPLGYGGFRERSLEAMCQWVLNDVEDSAEQPTQQVFDFA